MEICGNLNSSNIFQTPCNETYSIGPHDSLIKYVDPRNIYGDVWNSTCFLANLHGIMWIDLSKNFVMSMISISIKRFFKNKNIIAVAVFCGFHFPNYIA